MLPPFLLLKSLFSTLPFISVRNNTFWLFFDQHGWWDRRRNRDKSYWSALLLWLHRVSCGLWFPRICSGCRSSCIALIYLTRLTPWTAYVTIFKICLITLPISLLFLSFTHRKRNSLWSQPLLLRRSYSRAVQRQAAPLDTLTGQWGAFSLEFPITESRCIFNMKTVWVTNTLTTIIGT